ncbi:MAG TPA: heparinase II/III family protein [Gemmatimonadaceae bacterium]|nr:heparinase II/III family protein [Gemmatimonadaceae bacterium]
MSLLIADELIAERREAAATTLAPLADALDAELAPLLERVPDIPRDKARLTRVGLRCPRDGAMLEFDPWSPRAHRCSVCGTVQRGEAHDRMWIMWYQLWLGERAVHGALLHLLRGGATQGALAASLLERWSELYADYPNRDNALGPTRLFFSTYLESIWLLQCVIALDLLETAGHAGVRGGMIRDRLVEPSRALILSFDERGSNRQVWNAAALLASARLLGDERGAELAVHGSSGIAAQLAKGLLSDGTWYEGENYHLFAHRGLWYGVTLAERAGIELAAPLVARFEEGFATPFLSALPDLTLPSRRDSQYAISLRQWRFAELCELGLARRDDHRLRGALHALYAGDIPRRATGRDRSAAEVERNVPASALSRADLGWRSLLHARAVLPPLAPEPARSALLEGQGLAIVRRDAGRVYVSLDYGHSGGGHGHPDRLNLVLAAGPRRWLDDMGTGSYVDRTLHWYRSTLAHCAPLVDGRSQARVHGMLGAWEDRGGAGWVRAAVSGIAPGVDASRTVVALSDYLLDVLEWSADRDITLDLPVHLDGELVGARWRPMPLPGGDGLEDGFDFLRDTAIADGIGGGVARLHGNTGVAGASKHGGLAGAVGDQHEHGVDALAVAAHVNAEGAEWWRATAPAAPGKGDASFFILRQRGRAGRIISAWSWRPAVDSLEGDREAIVVGLADGAVHRHSPTSDGWRVELSAGGARSSIDLGGLRRARDPRVEPESPRPHPLPAPELAPLIVPRIGGGNRWLLDEPDGSGALRLVLGEESYRRSEEPWADAGAPVATLLLGARPEALEMDIAVATPYVSFVALDAENALDNEEPDIDGAGVQFYVVACRAAPVPSSAWVIVPRKGGADARVRAIRGHAETSPPETAWRRTPDGWALRVLLPLRSLVEPVPGAVFSLGLIVNHATPGRERRAGQLVLGGAVGEWVYLRGDRHPPSRYLPFVIAND